MNLAPSLEILLSSNKVSIRKLIVVRLGQYAFEINLAPS